MELGSAMILTIFARRAIPLTFENAKKAKITSSK